MDDVLKVQGLKVYFFTRDGVVKAVDGINLDVKRGETLGLVGESGCGKSTVALAIMRLVPVPGKIVSGQIVFEGENLLEKSDEEMRRIRGDKIAMIFQNPMTSLNPVYTVGDQITEAIILHQKLSRSKAKRKAIEMLELVGIPEAEKRFNEYPHEFSGGMQQRAMIAMALSCNPSLLISDEATTALDVTIQAQVLRLMKDLKKTFGSSILMITHDMGIVAQMCDRTAVMYAGDIVEFSAIDTIFKKPKHPYTQGLIGSIPRSDIEVKELVVIKGVVPDVLNPPSGCKFHPRCPYAMEVCSEQKPRTIQIEEGHTLACHLYT